MKINPEEFPEVEGNPRLGACIGKVGKLIAIGLNYADHAAETGVEVPPEPIIFMKATSKEANFEGAKFAGEANFRQAIFSREVDFYYATFLDVANFRQATFSGRS